MQCGVVTVTSGQHEASVREGGDRDTEGGIAGARQSIIIGMIDMTLDC